jgi:hypothetical protein
MRAHCRDCTAVVDLDDYIATPAILEHCFGGK